jgi:hypothetical protein
VEGMNSFQKRVLSQFRAKYKSIKPLAPPSWLDRSRWKPTFCMSLPNDTRIVAIDLIPSANIPRLIYREEVLALKRKHPQLRIVVCVLDKQLDAFPETEAFCREIDCGLQTFIPEVGLQTVVTTDLDRADKIDAVIEPGWFPKHILDKATNLTNLSFHKTINDFCQRVVPLADDEDAVTSLVYETVDRLLQHYPNCHANLGSFMKLAHFESMFRQVMPTATEHVLHSFRVFLAGCAVISRFYESFLIAHRRFCLGSERKMSIEYCWLLTAIFHDIGRPLEGGRPMLEAELEDEDILVSVVGKDTRWIKEKYSHARRILTSLGVFVASSPTNDDEWDAGAVPDAQDNALAAEWTNLYNRMSSHAAISAFDMLASIVEQARAVDERKNRPFVVTHATPAALAILLHDWRIWEDAKRWKLFPVNSGIIPMAALLIFIDTWDDFKRKGPASPISVESFIVTDAGVTVTVKWLKAEEYEKEKTKYTAFKKALKNKKFDMKIDVKVASA